MSKSRISTYIRENVLDLAFLLGLLLASIIYANHINTIADYTPLLISINWGICLPRTIKRL